jgi:hypothetical protein
MRVLNKNGIAPDENEKAALPNSASNIFWEEAKEMEYKKILAGNLLSRARGNRMRQKMMILKGSTHPRVKVWEGEAKPQTPCKGFMQKCKEMVVGYMAHSTSTTRNENPETQGESQVDQTQMQNPEPNLGEGEFSHKTS